MPSLSFLDGQPAWLVVVIFAMAVLGYVLRGQLKRTGDTGSGREALTDADQRADYLFDKAMESAAEADRLRPEVERLQRALRACEDTLTEAGIRNHWVPVVDGRDDQQ